MPLAIYMGMRAFGLEVKPRRQCKPEGLLGSSLAGQPLRGSASGTTTHTLWRSQYRITLKPAPFGYGGRFVHC